MNAVITGGTKGIGKAIAYLLADKGINIATCSRNQKDLNLFKKDLVRTYPKIRVFTEKRDLSRKKEVLTFGESLLQNFETIDILVNNAGIFIPGSIYSEPDGNLEKLIDTNLFSAYHLTRFLLPPMLKQEGGHIFNICSIASIIAYPNGGSYAISKFALLGFSKCLREELKDKGIKVTAILPGATWSDSWSEATLPEHRLMQAHDIALAVWNALQMSPSAVVEEIIIRPQLGDL
jgi:short-subunit dehydrogenase